MHYYQFNIGDYSSHTKGLSLMEDLAYRRLLDEYYLAERPLNGCSTTVARMIGMRDNKAEVSYVLSLFFVQNDDGTWSNPRADREIESFRAKLEQASRAGRASAERRLNAGSTDVQRSSTDVQPNINQEPITNNQKTKEKELAAQKKPRSQNSGTRMPDSWTVPDDWMTEAVTIRPDLPRTEIIRAAASFVDYWISQPGQKGRKSNWRATWRNWIRNTRGPNNGGPHQQDARSRAKRVADKLDEIARRDIAQRGGLADTLD